MTKLPYGPANERILKSRGPCRDNITSMYHTSYANSFATGVLEKRQVNSVNKIQVVNRPTGYNANFRPAVYYASGMDDLDNPALKMNVNEHYKTGNENDFRPYHISPTGEGMGLKQHDILPNVSGFTTMNARAYIQPTSSVVANVYGQKAAVSGLARKKIMNHDPVAAENQGTGPNANSTENQTRFKGKQGRWQSQSWRFHKSIGQKEPTANTRVHPFDPIEYLPKNPYRHDNSNSQYYKNGRPTGVSEHETHYQKHQFHTELQRKGANGISEPVPMSERNTGYSHETTKPRYTDFVKAHGFNDDTYLSPNRSDAYKLTLARYSFTAPGIPCTNLVDGVGRRHVGSKEATGYVKNHPSYNRCRDSNYTRFDTHYGDVFCGKDSGENNVAACNAATLALSRGGWPVMKAPNGFTKSTRVHAF